jgi:hypothetical protein
MSSTTVNMESPQKGVPFWNHPPLARPGRSTINHKDRKPFIWRVSLLLVAMFIGDFSAACFGAFSLEQRFDLAHSPEQPLTANPSTAESCMYIEITGLIGERIDNDDKGRDFAASSD